MSGGLGIDVGTRCCAAAVLDADGTSRLCPDRGDPTQFLTPSVIHLRGGRATVGRAAEAALLSDPALAAVDDIKGRLDDAAWRHTDDGGRPWSAAALCALLLRKLRRDGEASQSLAALAIGVPVTLGDAGRRALRQAGEWAGSESITLIEEPVAAATQVRAAEDRPVLVCDLGASGFQAAVLRLAPEGPHVLAKAGARGAGGAAIESALASLVERHAEQTLGRPLALDIAGRRALRWGAEKIKRVLCSSARAEHVFSLAGRPVEFVFTLTQFERLLADPMERMIQACRECLGAAGAAWADLGAVALTGGDAQNPVVRRRLAEAWGRGLESLQLLKAQEAVAHGLARLGAPVGRRERPAAAVSDVCGEAVGLRVRNPRTGKDSVKVLIPRGAPLPARSVSTFVTTRENQLRMVFEVVQGSPDSGGWRSLGHTVFALPPGVERNLPVELRIECESDGLVKVTAREAVSGKEMTAQVSRDAGDGRSEERLADADMAKRARGTPINE